MIIIRFFAAVLFCPLGEIGWDPTITRAEGHEDQFDIVVHTFLDSGATYSGIDRIFRTIECISAEKVGSIRGRATRAWRCVELDSAGRVKNGKQVVLKDTWIDIGRMPEGFVKDELIAATVTDKERTILEEGLLTVLCHGNVLLDPVNRVADVTALPSDNPVWQLMNEFGPSAASLNRKEEETRKMNKPRKGAEVTTTPIIYHQKGHYRVVFKEVGITLNNVRSLSNNFKAIAQLIQGSSSPSWVSVMY